MRTVLAAVAAATLSLLLAWQPARAQDSGLGGVSPPTRTGRIVTIRQSEGVTLAQVRIDPVSTEGLTGIGSSALEIQKGMSARLVFSIGTAFFRMPIGFVASVDARGENCVVRVVQGMLAQTVQDPTTGAQRSVADFFQTGAEVSLSAEPLS